MQNRDDGFLLDMVLAARIALDFAAGMNFDAFADSPVVRTAVMHQIQIVGEAASRVSDETRSQFPDLPWRDIVGMRNRLVHDYGNVDPVRVWESSAVT